MTNYQAIMSEARSIANDENRAPEDRKDDLERLRDEFQVLIDMID